VTQPRFTPIEARDAVRAAKHLGPPRPWVAHRPAEHRKESPVERRRIGAAGPDQGYALLLAESMRDAIILGHGEHLDDALAVAVQVALRRAAGFGRAPIRADLETALTLLSYLSPISDEAAEIRRATVIGASHDPWRRREIAESIPDDVCALDPKRAAEFAVDWTTTTAP
jgi:hypothetical protein